MKRAGNDDEQLMVLSEVAELTRQPESTLRWLRHQNRGPAAIKLGRRLVYRRSAVLAWIRQQEEEEQAGAR